MPRSTNSGDEIPPGLAALQESVKELSFISRTPRKRQKGNSSEKKKKKTKRGEEKTPTTCRTPDSLIEVLSDTGRISALGTQRRRKETPLSDSKILAGKPRLPKRRKARKDDAAISTLDIDRILEETAARNNLTAFNVKSIIKNVIKDPSVQKLLNRRLREEGENSRTSDSDSDFDYEPKLTRSRKRAMLGPLSQPATQETSWPETRALIEQEFPEDSSDEEYQPDNTNVESEDESYISSQASDFGSPPASAKALAQAVEQSSDERLFKVPLLPRPLTFDEPSKDVIGLRTRSKHPIDTPVEHIEASFIPPDITLDMYDTDVDPEDEFTKFLHSMNVASESKSVANDDDEETDPEYNILEEEEQIDVEEFRYDRSVRIPKEEAKSILQDAIELDLSDLDAILQPIDEGFRKEKKSLEESTLSENGVFCLDPDDSQTVASTVLDATPAKKKNEVKAALAPNVYITICLPEETKKPEPTFAHLSDEVVPSSPLFSAQTKLRLEEQLRKHVQVLTQTFLITCQQPKFFEARDRCKSMLNDLDFRRSISLPFSVFNIFNLTEAIKLTADWKLYCHRHPEVNSEARQAYTFVEKDGVLLGAKPLFVRPHPELVRRMMESRVFLYPELLPRVTFFEENPSENHWNNQWMPGELMLLAQGLEVFTPWVKENSLLNDRGPRTVSGMIAQYMLPTRNLEEIFHKIRKLAVPGAKANPVKFYRMFGVAPPVSEEVIPFFPEEAKTLAEIPVDKLPKKWRKMVQPRERAEVAKGHRSRKSVFRPLNVPTTATVKCVCRSHPVSRDELWSIYPKKCDVSTNTDDFVYTSDESEETMRSTYSQKYQQWLMKYQAQNGQLKYTAAKEIVDWLSRSPAESQSGESSDTSSLYIDCNTADVDSEVKTVELPARKYREQRKNRTQKRNQEKKEKRKEMPKVDSDGSDVDISPKSERRRNRSKPKEGKVKAGQNDERGTGLVSGETGDRGLAVDLGMASDSSAKGLTRTELIEKEYYLRPSCRTGDSVTLYKADYDSNSNQESVTLYSSGEIVVPICDPCETQGKPATERVKETMTSSSLPGPSDGARRGTRQYIPPIPMSSRIRIVEVVPDSPLRTTDVVKEEADSTTDQVLGHCQVIDGFSKPKADLASNSFEAESVGSSEIRQGQRPEVVRRSRATTESSDDLKRVRNVAISESTALRSVSALPGCDGDSSAVREKRSGLDGTRDFSRLAEGLVPDCVEIVNDAVVLDSEPEGLRTGPSTMLENGATPLREEVEPLSATMRTNSVPDLRHASALVKSCAGNDNSDKGVGRGPQPQSVLACGSGTVLSFSGAFSSLGGDGGAGGDDGDDKWQQKKVPDDGEPEAKDLDTSILRKKKKRSHKPPDPENVLASLNAKPDDVRFAHEYIERVRSSVPEETSERFVELLQTFDEQQGALELYKQVLVVLKGHDELCNEFIVFLKPEEAQRCGKIFEKALVDRMRDFFAVLMAYFKGQPAHVKRIISTLGNLQSAGAPMDKVKVEIVPLLRGHVYLENLFLSLLPSEEPRFDKDHEPEEILMNSSSDSSNGFEVAKNPSFEEEPAEIASNQQCDCNCHKAATANPDAHCYDCGLKFSDGKVYVKTESGMKLATVLKESAATNTEELSPSTPKSKKKSSPRSRDGGAKQKKEFRRIAPTFIGPRGSTSGDML